MADIVVDSNMSTSTARGMRAGPVWKDSNTGYFFFIDLSGNFSWTKSTDGGATWAAAVDVSTATTNLAFDIWYDKWTPGDSGTKVHCWWFNTTTNTVLYNTVDISSDTLGTERTVFAGVSAVAGRGAFVSGTKTRSGYLYCAYDMDAGVEKGLHRSTDGGPTWSASLDATFVEATIDECELFPASNTGDDNDCWALYQHASVDALTLKMWDSSAAAAVESATIQALIENVTDLTGQRGFAGSVRHSDGHLIVAAVSEFDTATGDHQVFDINGTGSITALTAITTNIDDHYYPAVCIDQFTANIYVAYNGKRDGSEVIATTTKVYYAKSTDGGTSWSAGDTAYMEAAAAVVVQVWAPLMGSRFYPVWRVGTTLNGNNVNSVVFTPLAAPIIMPMVGNQIYVMP